MSSASARLRRTRRELGLDPLGENGLCLAGEALDRELELSGEPSGRILAGRRGSCRRTACAAASVACWASRATARRTCSTCRLLDLGELRGDPLGRLGVLALDLLLQLELALPQAFGDLLQCSAPLGGVAFELGVDRSRHLLQSRGRDPRAP